jgi:GTPase SAR1 family protein
MNKKKQKLLIPIREKFELLFKLIIIGDTSVGKSCISFTTIYAINVFTFLFIIKVNSNSKHTVGSRVWLEIPLSQLWRGSQNAQIVNLGHSRSEERCRSVTRSYFRGSLGVVIVYDITGCHKFLLCFLAETPLSTFSNGSTKQNSFLDKRRHSLSSAIKKISLITESCN